METVTKYSKCVFLVVFKSYYVVWKPKWNEILEKIEKKFKSYYVVWKLFSVSPIFEYPTLFKSYYVVWKQIFHMVYGANKRSLNRTM